MILNGLPSVEQKENSPMYLNRRGFLKRASQFAMAATVTSARPAVSSESEKDEKTSSIPIVDTHQHLWDLSKLKLTWVRPPLDRSFTLEDYMEASRGLNVVKAVYMEVAAPREQRLEEAEYVIGLCKDPDSVTQAAVIAGSPAEEGFPEYVARFRGNPYVKGVRGALPPKRMGDKDVIENLHLLGDLGMRFGLNMPAKALGEAAPLVERCPDTRFILDHCGNADPVAFFPAGRTAPRRSQHSPMQWKRDMDRVAARENVTCKISGIVDNVPGYPLTAEDLAPIIDHCLDTFGPDRVIFASDWPVCLRGASLRKWVELLKEVTASRPETEQRKLFHDNAVKLYDLASEGDNTGSLRT